MVRLSTSPLAFVISIQLAAAIKEIGFGSWFSDPELTFGNNKYFVFWSKQSSDSHAQPHCYADAGTLEFDVGDLTNIVSFWSGNNKGRFEDEPGDEYKYTHKFKKHVEGEKEWGQLVYLTID